MSCNCTKNRCRLKAWQAEQRTDCCGYAGIAYLAIAELSKSCREQREQDRREAEQDEAERFEDLRRSYNE